MNNNTLVRVDLAQLSFAKEKSVPVLQTIDLRMEYLMGKVKVRALRGVNLSVHPGEFLSIMGPSGCGKSTLLHLLGGLLTPTGGEVWVGGQNMTGMADGERTQVRKEKIGFVFQRFNLFPTLTVEGNLKLAERIYSDGLMGTNGNSAHRDEILAAVGLQEKKHHKPTELSGGEQQRVALARAIIHRPAVLLADEPTGNLDSENSDAVLGLIKELNQRFGQTVIMITHDPWAAEHSDRILFMKDGKIDD
jgi:putative ABC transport system ATP-binding protein